MSNGKLVSVITPCYNGEKFVKRFFENILAQTYQNIELIFINDGSSDKTEEIAKSYIPKFEKNGRILHYIYQNNAGQAAAINKGLPIFRGEYMMWTDADDLLNEQNIEKKVKYMEQNPDVGIVMCRGKKVSETDLNAKLEEYYRLPPKGEDKFFEDLLISKNVVFTPGIYMVRRNVVLRAFPERHILESRIGQNFQLLLPMAYIAKCGYINEDLFSYVIRCDSHSNEIKDMEDAMKRDKEHEKVVLKLLDIIQPENKKMYVHMVRSKYMRAQMDAAYLYKDKNVLKEKYYQLKANGVATKRDTLIYLAGRFKVVDLCYSVFKFFKKRIHNKMAKNC